MTKNQVRVLYAGGAWFIGFTIYRLGGLPRGWDAIGEAIGYVIGYSALSAVPILLIAYLSFGKKRAAAPAVSEPLDTKAAAPQANPQDQGCVELESAEQCYQKALSQAEESRQAECFRFLERSIALDPNHVRSLYAIAHHYMHGTGVEADQLAASKCLQRAAELGFPPAQDKLALMYEHGKGVERNLGLAEAWYRKAAEMRYADAQYHLGVLYGSGDGVSHDFIESAMWCRRAAEQGHPDAQATLGRMYMEGLDGIPKSVEEAAKWLSKAAENGDAEAQFDLGQLFEYGEGVPQDLKEALHLYSLAAGQGHEDGQLGVERLDFYLGRHTESPVPLPDETDLEFRSRRLAESTRFAPPKSRNRRP